MFRAGHRVRNWRRHIQRAANNGGSGGRARRCALALALAWGLTAAARADDPEPPALRVGADENFPPFQFLDRGEVAGLDVDVMKAVAGALHRDIEFHAGVWSEIRAAFDRGELDVVMGMTPTPEREGEADFSIPYLVLSTVAVVRPGVRLRRPDELRSLRVALLEGGVLAEVLARSNLVTRPVPAPSDPDALAEVARGGADAAVVPYFSWLRYEEKHPGEGLRCVRLPLPETASCLAVREGNERLRTQMNEALAAIKASGEFQAINERWLGVYERRARREWLWPVAGILAGAVGLLGLAALWTFALRRRVRQKTSELECELRERIRAEEALRQSEANYREIYDAAHDAIFVHDAVSGRLLDVNRQAVDMYGFTRAEFLAMPVAAASEGASPFSEVEARAALHRAAAGEPQLFDWHARRKNGELFWTEISLRRGTINNRACVLAIVRDITERRAAAEDLRESEERLRAAQKMEALGRLAGGVAHDLNNLITPILGYGRLLRETGKFDAQEVSDLDEIVRAGERAADLTRQLLAFGRKQRVEVRPLSVNAIVAEMEKLLRRTLGEHIELDTVLDEGAGPIKADAGQIEQVIMNLAVNARDAMPRGGQLHIRTEGVAAGAGGAPGEGVLLAVRDTGSGMTDEVRARLFEPFFTTKTGTRSSGLGLSTVYGIVAQFGGQIEVTSAPGAGAEFRVWFPQCDEPLPPPPAAAADTAPLPGGTETILVAEDEHAVRRLTVRVLRDRGYRILEASGGEEALQLARATPERIDLLLTDVVMPQMSGVELAARMRALRPGCRVLYTTGFTPDEILQHGGVDRSAPIVLKPYSVAGLSRKVRQILDQPAPGGVAPGAG